MFDLYNIKYVNIMNSNILKTGVMKVCHNSNYINCKFKLYSDIICRTNKTND